MADLSDINSAQSVKLIGADSAGLEQTPVQSTSNGGLHANLRNNAGTEIGTSSNPVRTDTTGTTTQPVSDSGGSLTVDQATASNLNAQVVGEIASGAADSGNPVKIAGVFNTTLPTVTNGQRVTQQMSSRGEQLNSERNSNSRLSGAATTVIKSGAGYLRRVLISGPANSTLTLYDNTAGSGTIIAIINSSNGLAPSYLEFGLDFTTGLTAVTTGASSNYNILFL